MGGPKFVPGVEPPADVAPGGRWYVFQEARLLVGAGDGPVRIPHGLPGDLGLPLLRHSFLGTFCGVPCFAAEVAKEQAAPEGWTFEGLRRLFPRIDEEFFRLAARAFQVKEWDRCHRYCGACGGETLRRPGERARVCPACGELYYPRLSPVVMILIRRGRDLLLARSPRFPSGMYSALAGFVEPGETLEETAAREVREEVGLEIANLRYFASQSWPFPHSLMIAFVADHAGGEIRLEDPEIEDAGWYPPERLPDLPHPLSIARRLIDSVVAQTRPQPGRGTAGAAESG